jgi:hypothetical protein
VTESQLRRALGALDARLDDVRREQGWRGIERTLDAPVAPTPARRGIGWPLAFGLAATTAAILAVLLLQRPATATVDELAPTALVAGAGEHAIVERDGLALTLVGPGAATVARVEDAIRVRVIQGTLVAERRSEAAPSLALEAGGNTTISRDSKLAVHVAPATVVLGTGAQADQILERYTFKPTTPVSPVVPPPASPPPAEPRLETRAARKVVPVLPVPAPDVPREDDVVVKPEPVETALDAATLYRHAEVALASRDPDGARELLERLLREHPNHALVDAARYDLALIARGRNDLARALELLAQIRTTGKDKNLRAAAARLEQQLRAK